MADPTAAAQAGWDPDWWPAPAKLNLMLRIVGRRADGYHLLQTVFQFLDWGDELAFEPTADPAIRLQTPTAGVDPDSDLTVRAARLLQQAAGQGWSRPQGARIRVRKRVPMGGGLGGGSSDAATTLVALDRLWGLGLGERRLAELGLALGADVPVFVAGHAAWAEGVGERLRPIEPEEPWYLVLHPGVSVATGAVFAHPDLTRDSPIGKMADFLRDGGVNDCEPIVRRCQPAVGAALDWLGAYAPARLTGTGACVFAAFASRERAAEVARRVPSRWQGFVARGCNRSALRAR